MSQSEQKGSAKSGEQTDYDAIVVGAGFSGLYQLHRLRDELGLSVKVVEKADDVGGTWYWNKYPGAQCDSESHSYCYMFNDDILEEWRWSKRYPEQPEVLEYLRYVTDKLDLRKDIEFNTEVTAARFDEDNKQWHVSTADGSTLSSQFLVSAVGCLSEPYIPDFENRDAFEGFSTHTARWPKDGVDLEDKRVAVIGTGSTGIQVSPRIAERDIEHLTVFQRTANYAIPAQDRPFDDDDWAEIQDNYDEIVEKANSTGAGMHFGAYAETAEGLSDEEIEEILDTRWEEGGFRFQFTFEDLIINPETNEKVSEYIRDRIREQVDDPELAEKLVPTDHYYATKRPPLEEGYYEMFNEDHVSLVDVTENPIEEFTPDGIQTADDHHDFDAVIFATGFDAMTGAILELGIEGRDGLTLDEKWENGPKTYLGVSAQNFPNLFMVTGPQSPSVLGNMPVTIENSVEFISSAIGHAVENDIDLVEPTREAEEAWTAHNAAVAEQTLYDTVDSWYRNQNIPGQPAVFTPYIGGYDNYHYALQECAEKGYEGFQLTDSTSELGDEGDVPDLEVMAGQAETVNP
jgi:cyclohexanone monooxygenase